MKDATFSSNTGNFDSIQSIPRNAGFQISERRNERLMTVRSQIIYHRDYRS
jgi:hypothetical protein